MLVIKKLVNCLTNLLTNLLTNFTANFARRFADVLFCALVGRAVPLCLVYAHCAGRRLKEGPAEPERSRPSPLTPLPGGEGDKNAATPDGIGTALQFIPSLASDVSTF